MTYLIIQRMTEVFVEQPGYTGSDIKIARADMVLSQQVVYVLSDLPTKPVLAL